MNFGKLSESVFCNGNVEKYENYRGSDIKMYKEMIRRDVQNPNCFVLKIQRGK